MEYEVFRGGVLDAEADIIVNAANNNLQAGSGVCGAIFHKAGFDELQEECDNIGFVETGDVAVTGGYKTGAKHIIHAVGPTMWNNRKDWQRKIKQVYWNSLVAADATGVESIAFPCISTGIYACPLEDCARFAIDIVRSYEAENLKKVYFCCFKEEEYQIYTELSAKAKANEGAFDKL